MAGVALGTDAFQNISWGGTQIQNVSVGESLIWSARAVKFVSAHGETPDSPSSDPNMDDMPEHEPGDLLIMLAFRQGLATLPTLPTGWTEIINRGQGSNSARVGCKVALTSNESSGNWTNADGLLCVVYRGVSGIGATASASDNSATLTIPGLTLSVTDGTSRVLSLPGSIEPGTDLSVAPAGMQVLTDFDFTGDGGSIAAYDTGGGVSSFSAKTKSISTVNWISFSIELLAA